MDRIDQIIDALNAALPDIPVGRDAMEDDTPEDWGAVELSGADHFLADGRVIDTDWRADVWICAADRGTDLAATVSETLAGLADEWYSSWYFQDRNYLYDIDKVLWHWVIMVPDPLEIPGDETETGDGTGDGNDPDPGDGTGDGNDPDPEPDPDPGTGPEVGGDG